MTTEELIQRQYNLARAFREQEVRNIMAITGCDRERAEKLHAWISADMERAGRQPGERLAKGFRQLASITSRYRT